jgi:uncharacterized membrane-anchored protein
MKNKLLSKLLLMLFVIQFLVLVFCVAKYEFILHYGKEIRLKTAPIDPIDVFRGRYVTLDYDIGRYSCSKEFANKLKGKECFVLLKEGADGIYTISSIKLKEPSSGVFLKLAIRYSYAQIRFDIPFNRFYMQEDKATTAEELYRKANSRSKKGKSVCYASVVVYNGDALIKDLYINGIAITKLAESELEQDLVK